MKNLRIVINGTQIGCVASVRDEDPEELERLPIADVENVKRLSPAWVYVFELFRRFVAKDSVKTEEDYKFLGQLLYRMIFTKNIEKRFAELLKEGVTTGESLRVILEFQGEADQDLAELPWEYLYFTLSPAPHPGPSEGFLSTETDLILTRYVKKPSYTRSTQPNDVPPVRVLFIVSNPNPLLLSRQACDEWADMKQTYDDVIDSLPDTIQPIDPDKPIIKVSTYAEFQSIWADESIKRFKPHIIHFFGHGKFDDYTGQCAIAFNINNRDTLDGLCAPMKDGRVDLELAASTSTLNGIQDSNLELRPGELFVQAIDDGISGKWLPRLMFLHVCDSGVVKRKAGVLQGLVPSVFSTMDVPAVIAMQRRVTLTISSKFATSFYRELGKNGRTVEQAVQSARRNLMVEAVASKGDVEFGVPVLFLIDQFKPILEPFFGGNKAVNWEDIPVAAGEDVLAEIFFEKVTNIEANHDFLYQLVNCVTAGDSRKSTSQKLQDALRGIRDESSRCRHLGRQDAWSGPQTGITEWKWLSLCGDMSGGRVPTYVEDAVCGIQLMLLGLKRQDLRKFLHMVTNDCLVPHTTETAKNLRNKYLMG